MLGRRTVALLGAAFVVCCSVGLGYAAKATSDSQQPNVSVNKLPMQPLLFDDSKFIDNWFRTVHGTTPFDRDFFISDLTAPRLFRTPMEVTEDKQNLIVTAEVPGFDESNLTVDLAPNSLTIKGESDAKETDQKKAQTKRASFYQSMSLPCTVDPDKSVATIKNGILTLTLPKTPNIEPQGKRIAIRKD